ncbi:MAG TPA: SRPBCC domain-containing protein [Nitrospirota bacterium]|nr:SRPBCC domain-containing protein [Nitrospirota bacterium]
MVTKKNLTATSAEKELVINRTFNAPRERVFNAWVDQKLMSQWWGPKGFTNPVCEMDVRQGGAMRIDMRGPDGTVYPMKGVFHEILPPQRLVFISSALEDETGHAQLENMNIITFIATGKTSTITVHVTVMKSAPAAQGALKGMPEGWNQSLDRLAELLVKT